MMRQAVGPIVLLMVVVCSCAISAQETQRKQAKHFGLDTSPSTFAHDIKYVKDLGLDTIRINLAWGLAEPKPGEFDWSVPDKIVAKAQGEQIEVLFNVATLSEWATKDRPKKNGIYHSSSAPKDMKQWEAFLEKLATRYRGKGVFYEIGNEVNAPTFWTGTMDEYLQLLKASYAVIKRADPQTRVLTSAMACGVVRNMPAKMQEVARKRNEEWLRAILATKAFDVVSVHDYYFPSDIVANGQTFRSSLEHTRILMKEGGIADYPVWLTESGYVSRPTDVSGRTDRGSPENQAKWLKEAYQQTFELGVERIFWLLLSDRDEPYFGSMGLLDTDGKERPAYKILKELATSRD